MSNIYTNIQTYFFFFNFAHAFGVPLLSALAPESPFSVLSFPEELTRHSLLQETGKKNKGEDVDSWREAHGSDNGYINVYCRDSV